MQHIVQNRSITKSLITNKFSQKGMNHTQIDMHVWVLTRVENF